MITLRYVNNVSRLVIDEVSLPAIATHEDAAQYILGIYQKAGHIEANDPEKLYVRTSANDFRPLLQSKITESDCIIDYVDIVSLNNAVEFARKDGIVFFFHTSEQGHQNNPHVHAAYSGDEISIYFSDLHTCGRMKSSAKKRVAIAYVEENRLKMLDEWKRIMGGQA